MNFCESSDLTERKGRYGKYSLKIQILGGAGSYIWAIRVVQFTCEYLYRGFIGWSPVNLATRIAISRNAKSRRLRGFFVGHNGVSKWIGGMPFKSFMEWSPELIALGFVILRSPKSRQGWGSIENSNSHVYWSFGKSGFGSQGDKFLNIAITEILIGKIPKEKGQRWLLSGFGDSRDQCSTYGFAKVWIPIS